MTKPANFPERKRQRQLRALGRIKSHTKAGVSNLEIIGRLHERTASNARGVMTKKVRG